MANHFQKIIYSFSNLLPLSIPFAIVFWIQCKNWIIPLIIVLASILLSCLYLYNFDHLLQKTSVKEIKVSSVSSAEKWILGYITGYIVPFITLSINKINFYLIFIVLAVFIFALSFMIIDSPNVLLFIKHCHFYKVDIEENHIKGYLLITKDDELRDSASIKKVKRIFERVLVQVDDDDRK